MDRKEYSLSELVGEGRMTKERRPRATAPLDRSSVVQESQDANSPPSTRSSATESDSSTRSSARIQRELWNQTLAYTYGYKNVKHCYVNNNPLVALRWNGTSNRYEVVKNSPDESNSTSANQDGARWLGRSMVARKEQQESQPAIGASSSSSQQQPSDLNDSVVYGRLCHCVSDLLPSSASSQQQYYCPDFIPTCEVQVDRPASSQPVLTVTCSNATNTNYAKYVFPLALFLFAFYAVLCFCSPKGLAARMYAKKRVCRRLKESDDRFEEGLEDELEWMLQRQRARHEMAMAQQQQLQHQEPRQPPPPIRSSSSSNALPPPARDGESRGAGARPPSHRQHNRVLIPGSTPFSALLLEVSNRQQRRHNHNADEVELPTTTTAAHGASQRRLAAAVAAAAPTMVLLKTRQYDGVAATKATNDSVPVGVVDSSGGGGSNIVDESGGQERAGECTCSICLTDLAVGDRVGDLPCQHLFHATCLKDWIRRRNQRCPLCMAAIPLSPKVQPQPLAPNSQPFPTAPSTSDTLTEPSMPTSSIT